MTQKLTRRDFLKTLLPGSAALLGATLLAGRWVKPAAALGQLPAHALLS